MSSQERQIHTPIILALDIGSSSIRCSAYDAKGDAVPDSLCSQSVRLQADGTLPTDKVRAGVEQVLDQCLALLRQQSLADGIAAVSWASFAMSWLGVDENGRAVTPIFTYADNRSASYTKKLRQQLSEDGSLSTAYQRTGTPIHNAYAPAQLLRLAAEKPLLLKKVAHWQTVASHLLACWSGRAYAPVSSSEASWTGLLNRASAQWDELLLGYLPDVSAQLPPVHDYSQSIQGLAPKWAQRWPELQEATFFLAVGDGAAANIGSGCIDAEHVALTIGTSGAMRIVAKEEDVVQGESLTTVPQGLWSYRLDHRRHLLGGALTDGGSLYAWLVHTLQYEDEETLIQTAAGLAPDSHGLTLLPFLNGERSPGWAENARLTIDGLTGATTPPEIVRAGLEAVALRFGLIAALLDSYIPATASIYASGGALHAIPLWRQILADVLNRPLHLTDVNEATSRGAVLLALEAMDVLRLENAQPQIVHTSPPDAAAHTRYQEAAKRQQAFYRQILGSESH